MDLITSRRFVDRWRGNFIQIGCFDASDSVKFLRRATDRGEDDEQVNHAIILSEHALYGVFSLCA